MARPVWFFALMISSGLTVCQAVCEKDTGGSCNVMGCKATRGKTECKKLSVFKHKCFCQPGYCAVEGACVPPKPSPSPYPHPSPYRPSPAPAPVPYPHPSPYWPSPAPGPYSAHTSDCCKCCNPTYQGTTCKVPGFVPGICQKKAGRLAVCNRVAFTHPSVFFPACYGQASDQEETGVAMAEDFPEEGHPLLMIFAFAFGVGSVTTMIWLWPRRTQISTAPLLSVA